jgi:hypothetical protein
MASINRPGTHMRFGGCHIDGAVQPDNGAERTDRISFVGFVERISQSSRHRTAAGIVVLDHAGRRLSVLRHDRLGGVKIEQIVVGQLFAVQAAEHSAMRRCGRSHLPRRTQLADEDFRRSEVPAAVDKSETVADQSCCFSRSFATTFAM